MDMYSKRQYLSKLQTEYRKANKEKKTLILNEYIKNTGHNRKYVIRQLNCNTLLRSPVRTQKKALCKYKGRVIDSLVKLHQIFDCPCGQRFKPIIEMELERLRGFKEIIISDADAHLLKQMSPATIDRKIKRVKHQHTKKGFTTTKPGTLLKSQIQIRLTEWDTSKVGYQEVDLVAHGGGNSSGHFAYTVSLTEIATGWWEGEVIMGKGQRFTFEALKRMRERTPYDWRGLDSDNGSEFINHTLLKYTQDESLEFTRSRPNHKNDNAYVEQKNWTHVRQVVGYARYDTDEEIEIMNRLYRHELRLYKNFFQPIMKLKKKNRVGGKVKRKYEKAKTPYQRLLESNDITKKQKNQLMKIYENLNPAELSRQIDRTLYRLHLVQENKDTQFPVDKSATDVKSSPASYPLIPICPQRKSTKKKLTTTTTSSSFNHQERRSYG